MSRPQSRLIRSAVLTLQRARRLASRLRRDSQAAGDRAVELEGFVYRTVRALIDDSHPDNGRGKGGRP